MNDMGNNEILSDGLERVADAAKFLGVSRSLIYKLIDAGVLPAVKVGTARRIPIRAVRDLVADQLERRDHPDGR